MKRKVTFFVACFLVWILLPVFLIFVIQEDGTLMIKKEVSIEEYLPLIVVNSMEKGAHEETVKAMSVIMRSNFTKRLENQEITFSDIKKKYGTMDRKEYIKNQEQYQQAVEVCKETKGEILTYKGDVCYCPFFYLSNGRTRDAFVFFENSEYPYLISVPSYRDEECDTYLSYHYFTTEDFQLENNEDNGEMDSTMSEETVEETTAEMENSDRIGGIEILEMDQAGYVTWVKVGDQVMGGEAFRETYGLPSSCFTIEQEEQQIRIICKGNGHGFGFSQYGGNAMAKEGHDYKALIRHYFPEVSLEKSV